MNKTKNEPHLPQRPSNHWKFTISVMGATPKQRSIYINTWIGGKASVKKKQAVRTEYGEYFHIKHASNTLSLDLYVHDIQNNLKMSPIWDSIILNVIVLPFNHSSQVVEKPLKQLIRELTQNGIPLRKLFSRTLLICPSHFTSVSSDEFLKQSQKVREGLLHVLFNGFGPRAKTLHLKASDIVMMESGRKSSMLPTAKDWRVNATEYVLKYLILSDRDRKAFIAWISNCPNPLRMENIRHVCQRLKTWKTSRRRCKEDAENDRRQQHVYEESKQRTYHKPQQQQPQQQRTYAPQRAYESGKLRPRQSAPPAATHKKSTRPKLSDIAKDFDKSSGIEEAVDSEYKRVKKKIRVHKTRHRTDDEKTNTAMNMKKFVAKVHVTEEEDEEVTNKRMLQKINRAAHAKTRPNDDSKEAIKTPRVKHVTQKNTNTVVKPVQNKSKVKKPVIRKEKSEDTETDSDEEDSEDDTDDETDSDEDDTDDTDEEDTEDEMDDDDDSDSSHNKTQRRNSDELKQFCKAARLTRYYDKMVALGFNSSSEFMDLSDRDFDEMITKLHMLFKDEKQLRKSVNAAKIACGMKQETPKYEVNINAKRLEIAPYSSESPLSNLEGNESPKFNVYEEMEDGKSKNALLDLHHQVTEFSKVNRKCGDSLNTLRKSYCDAQSEMDRVYGEYKRQIEEAHNTARELLHTFVCGKQDKLVKLQKRMKSDVRHLKACENACIKACEEENHQDIRVLINDTMRRIKKKLPADCTVASGKFDVEFVDKLNIFPPVLQPDSEAHYTPNISGARSRANSNHMRHRSKSTDSNHSRHQSGNSLQDIIENNGVVLDNQALAPQSSPPSFAYHSHSPIIQTKKTPLIRRNSVVLGDVDLDAIQEQQLQKTMTPPPVGLTLISPHTPATMVPMNPPYTPGMIPYMPHPQAGMMYGAHNPYMMQHQQMQLQQLQQQQQQAVMNRNATNGSRQKMKKREEEEASAAPDDQVDDDDELEWRETNELWRNGRVVLEKDKVTVNGAACLVADVEINKFDVQNNTFCWEIYVEKISNRCWIGIMPGPISSIQWKTGACPPNTPKAIGVENTYGFMYCGTTKVGSIGRAPKNRDHIRFKLDMTKKILYGSLNDRNCNNIWYEGKDIPNIACVVVINSSGKGKFQIRR